MGMVVLRILLHFGQQLFILAEAEDDLYLLTPASQRLVHHLIIHHAPAATHDQHGWHILEAELLQDIFASGMLPEVRMDRHAGHLDFGGGYASPAQLCFHFGGRDQIAVYLGADPAGVGIVIGDDCHERHLEARIEPFQAGDHSARNKVRADDNIGL
ncbi:hypothetical protein D3C73_1126810 [compost metagenome]